MSDSTDRQSPPTSTGSRGNRLILIVVAIAIAMIAAVAIIVMLITNNDGHDPSTGTPQPPRTVSSTTS